MARALAARPYAAAAATQLPAGLNDIDYDAYRDIRFDPAHALWRNEGLPFQLQFFHRGGAQRARVDLFEVVDGQARRIAYSPAQFRFQRGAPDGLSPDLGFAGFRIHAPINRNDYFDEVAAFLGASYFRAVAKGMVYGLSARGLAIGAGANEEFPDFRSFWIERPRPGSRSLTVLALLDGASCAGAFRFVISPGETTVFDTTASLYPRRTIADAGIAPLTSMFLFGGDRRARFDDFRPQVHDSDGLAMADGAGERLWRPLANPPRVSTSAFRDAAPRGFGLIQRERRYDAYLDLEARYHLRPSLWVEPRQGFGPGSVGLVELPSPTEYEDNIVACWTPAQALRAGRPATFSYRLHWGAEPIASGLATVAATRSGAAERGRRRFVIDFQSPAPGALDGAQPQVTASAGSALEVNLHPNPETGGVRLSFELDAAGASAIELRAALLRSGKVCSEVWLNRWAA